MKLTSRLKFVAVVLLLLAVVIGCSASGARQAADSTRSQVTETVGSALAGMKQIFVLPRGVKPGSIDPQLAQTMTARAQTLLPQFYAAPLLSSRLELFDQFLQQALTDPKMLPTRDGGVRDLVITSTEIDRDRATATGTYTSWLLGEDPSSSTPEEETEIVADRRFEITLRLIGEWLITSENIS